MVELSSKGDKKWGFPYLLMAVLLFFSIYVIRLYITKQSDPSHLYEAFQKKIIDSEREVIDAVGFLKSCAEKNSSTDNNRKTELQKQRDLKKQGICLFIFRNDSLIRWSDNKVILPADFTVHFAGSDFVLKLKNGWYGFHGEKAGSNLYLGSYLIRNEYPFQNEYLKNGFASRFSFPEIISIVEKPGKYPVHSTDGHYLFSLDFGQNQTASPVAPVFLVLLIFLLAGLSLSRFIYLLYSGIEWFANRKLLLVIFFGIDLVLLRVIQFYFCFPSELYASGLFGPSWYSSSAVLPSLGDFTINAVLIFIIALVFFKNGPYKPGSSEKPVGWRISGNTCAIFLLLLFFQTIGYLINDLVINSPLPLNLQNISGLVPESGYGLLIISALLFSFWLVSSRIFSDIFMTAEQKRWVLVSVGLAVILDGLIHVICGWKMSFMVILFFIFYFAAYWYIKTGKRVLYSIPNLLFFLCFYAIFSTFIMNQANSRKENEKLNLLAVKLATRRNPVTEVQYEQMEHKLRADSLLRQNFQPLSEGKRLSPDSIITYLKAQYFKDYWQKYNIQITLCDTMKDLRIQPQGYLINCNSYFNGIIRNWGEATVLPNLFFLDYGFGKEYYIAMLKGIDFGQSVTTTQTIFIELNLKNESPDPGYPGLLMDNARMNIPNLSDYSYGLFQKGRLVHAVGNYNYNIELQQYKAFSDKRSVFSGDQMIHHQYHIDDSTSLLISRKEEGFLTQISPFSYLFILFTAITLIVALIFNVRKNLQITPHSLRNRLHVSLILILVVALLAIGIVQVINIIDINTKKNTDNLRERAYSVMVEAQHKYSTAREIRDIPKSGLEDFLIKLSNVFFTDINFYDVRGMLISSSRPQIFEEGLVSERMNPEAFQKLAIDHKSIFVHNESIGRMRYSSAYLPFYNEQNTLLGYINLPYFSRQDELKKEISSFLVTFINVYILLFLFGLVITILISNYITAPLSLLAGKLSRLRFGGVNDKIAWNQPDEIGQLVTEYNRMVDELGKSAEMLARSERESAWREMARQVAHEIKNPLTPMKLSAQYLQKAWNEKAPDWDQRLARFTSTLVEQIDTLSAIASNFSDFAKMPVVVAETVDLRESVEFVLSMYKDSSGIGYEFISEVDKPIVIADRSQLIRVFTNLLNNAVQAIGDRKDGKIRVHLTRENERFVAKISDNGEGMSAARAQKIFQPNFTTKTGGMGLGLAIVKGIVEGMNGEISFISEEKKGTTFVIKIPAKDERLPKEPE
jgi:two-component system nitrogen regulation sensor histidine kinase NtrY